MKYEIHGMTCGGCVSRVEKALKSSPDIQSIHVQLEAPQAEIEFAPESKISLFGLQNLVHQAGPYTIKSVEEISAQQLEVETPTIQTYKPLAIIVGFILGVSLIAQWPFGSWDFTLWMRHFMAGFFLVFSAFKLLNLRGFAESYQMYDLLAARWFAWGMLYPFIELGLGLMYLTGEAPYVANGITIGVLGFSSIGVVRSVVSRQTIRCACLGDVFNLPMSTVTIVEDLSMVLMAGWMLMFG